MEKEFFTYRQHINLPETFTFFYATASPFSQWHTSRFKLEHLFSSAEQYMMYRKAMLFEDKETAEKILKSNDVRKIKQFGREVKSFDENIWESKRVDIVWQGNKAKFDQNKDLQSSLFATQGTTLVEAAPNDRVWGIGVAEDDARAYSRETWLGKNLLGEVLTQLRFELMRKY
jgi:ribA/ribD-fused uncharacterized protein